jgi:hypothetical protein
MKYLMLFPLLALASLSSSCRTTLPLDPMTMRPTCCCLPENFRTTADCPCVKTVVYTK